MAKSSKSAKQRRESKRVQRQQEKRERLQRRRALREQGLDPDNLDSEGRPLPYSDVARVTDIAPVPDADDAIDNLDRGSMGADPEGRTGR